MYFQQSVSFQSGRNEKMMEEKSDSYDLKKPHLKCMSKTSYLMKLGVLIHIMKIGEYIDKVNKKIICEY